MPNITVPAPVVNVTVEPTPIVVEPAAVNVTVDVPEQPDKTVKFTRDQALHHEGNDQRCLISGYPGVGRACAPPSSPEVNAAGRRAHLIPSSWEDRLSSTTLGVAAASWAVLMALSPLLQVREILRRGTSTGVSVGYFLVLLVGFALWIAYGAARHDLPLVIPNALALLVTSFTIAVAIRQRPSRPQA
jgi:MtN3 and saliva related transmembrane protein